MRADPAGLGQLPLVEGAAGQLDQRAGATLLGRALVVLTSGTDSGASAVSTVSHPTLSRLASNTHRHPVCAAG
jgi:hypothetical protein